MNLHTKQYLEIEADDAINVNSLINGNACQQIQKASINNTQFKKAGCAKVSMCLLSKQYNIIKPGNNMQTFYIAL